MHADAIELLLEVDPEAIWALEAFLGMTYGEQDKKFTATLCGAAVTVRRHLFQGKHGGRIVLLSGSRAEVIAALCRCVQVLHTSSAESEGSAFDDHACWGYNPPNDKDDDQLHTFPLHRFSQWRDKGFFTDATLPMRLPSAGCWLPFWAVLAAHQLAPHGEGAFGDQEPLRPPALAHSHEDSEAVQQEGSMPDMGQLALWDEDEEMADLEGQQLDDMTALLQELRERGLDPEMLEGLGQRDDYGGSSLDCAMDIFIEGEVLVSIVVDTNVFMERLSLLGRLRDNLRVLSRRLQQRVAIVPRIVVPSVVLLELDNFKDPHKARGQRDPEKATELARRSRAALRWLQQAQREDESMVCGQSEADRRQAEDSFVTDKKQTKNDDYVLYCAMLLQQQLQSRSGVACTVAVLTEDRPLRLKAGSNGLLGLGLQDIPWDLEQLAKVCLPEQLHHLVPDPHEHTVHSPRPPASFPQLSINTSAPCARPAAVLQDPDVTLSAPAQAAQPWPEQPPQLSLPQQPARSPLHALAQLPFSLPQPSAPQLNMHAQRHSGSQQQQQQLQAGYHGSQMPSFARPAHHSSPHAVQQGLALRPPQQTAREQPQAPAQWQERGGGGNVLEPGLEEDLEGLVGAVLAVAVGDLLLHLLQGNEFWADLVPCPPPWKPGEVLDILTNMWRSDFQALAGPQMGQQKACEEDLRGLKRQYHSRSKGRRKWADIAERLLQLLHLFISNLPADDGDLGNSERVPMAVVHRRLVTATAQLERSLQPQQPPPPPAYHQQPQHHGRHAPTMQHLADTMQRISRQHQQSGSPHEQPPHPGHPPAQLRSHQSAGSDMRAAPTLEQSWALQQLRQAASAPQGVSALSGHRDAGENGAMWAQQHAMMQPPPPQQQQQQQQQWQQQQRRQQQDQQQASSSHQNGVQISAIPPELQQAYIRRVAMLQQQQQQQHGQQPHWPPDLGSQTSAQHTASSGPARAYPPQSDSPHAGLPLSALHGRQSHEEPGSPHLSALLRRHSSLHSTGSGSIPASGMASVSRVTMPGDACSADQYSMQQFWMPPGMCPPHASQEAEPAAYRHLPASALDASSLQIAKLGSGQYLA